MLVEHRQLRHLSNLPIQDFTVSTGYLKVAAPELVALDLLEYTYRCGGLNNVVTVFSELIENLDADKLIKLACSKCKRINYWSRKNKKQVERKIELKKYCRWCRKQVSHKETKK